MANIKKVLVVGGGIAGLTLAVALRRRDIEADVVELAPEWNVLGVGISLTGPTLRALKSIGLIDQCEERTAILVASVRTAKRRVARGYENVY